MNEKNTSSPSLVLAVLSVALAPLAERVKTKFCPTPLRPASENWAKVTGTACAAGAAASAASTVATLPSSAGRKASLDM